MQSIKIYKGSDGLRRMFLITSNAYIDREAEIIRQKALETYVSECWKEGQWRGDNVLLFWHRGEPIGDIVDADMEGAFLLELAKERPDALVNLSDNSDPPFYARIKDVWDMIEKAVDIEWGVSPGFITYQHEQKAGDYQTFRKHETSVLPVEDAANSLTLSLVLRMI